MVQKEPLTSGSSGVGSPDRARLLGQGRRLEYLTLAWNLVEAVVAIGSGVGAGSAALVGFGVDSLIESTSGAVLLWRLFGEKGGEAKLWRQTPARRISAPTFLPSF